MFFKKKILISCLILSAIPCASFATVNFLVGNIIAEENKLNIAVNEDGKDRKVVAVEKKSESTTISNISELIKLEENLKSSSGNGYSVSAGRKIPYRYMSSDMKTLYSSINRSYAEINGKSLEISFAFSDMNLEMRLKMNKTGDLVIYSRNLVKTQAYGLPGEKKRVYLAGILKKDAFERLRNSNSLYLSPEMKSDFRYVNKEFLDMLQEDTKTGTLKSNIFTEVGIFNLLQFLPPVEINNLGNLPYYSPNLYRIVSIDKNKSPEDEFLFRMNEDARTPYKEFEDIRLLSKIRNQILESGVGKNLNLPFGKFPEAVQVINENLKVITTSVKGVSYSILLNNENSSNGVLSLGQVYRVVPTDFLEKTQSIESLSKVALYAKVTADSNMLIAKNHLPKVEAKEKDWLVSYKDNKFLNPMIFKDFEKASELSASSVNQNTLNLKTKPEDLKVVYISNRFFVLTPLEKVTNKKSKDLAMIEFSSGELMDDSLLNDWSNLGKSIKVIPAEYIDFLNDSELLLPLFNLAKPLNYSSESTKDNSNILDKIKGKTIKVEILSVTKLDPFNKLKTIKMHEVIFSWKGKVYKYEISEKSLANLASIAKEKQDLHIDKWFFFNAEPVMNYKMKIF